MGKNRKQSDRDQLDHHSSQREVSGMTTSASRTRVSLIRDLKLGKELAWKKFYDLYYPKLLGWARLKGLSQSDSEDLVGQLLTNLVRYIEKFEYDKSGSFRAYMHRSLLNVISQHFKKQARFSQVFSISEVPDERDHSTLDSILDVLCESEQVALLGAAKSQVLNEVPEDHQVIWTAITEDSAVAEELGQVFGMSRASVYRIKLAVSKLIKRRYEELSGDRDA